MARIFDGPGSIRRLLRDALGAVSLFLLLGILPEFPAILFCSTMNSTGFLDTIPSLHTILQTYLFCIFGMKRLHVLY